MSTLVMFMSSSSLSSCRRTSVRATRVNTCRVHVVVISALLQTNECESDPCQHLSCSCRRHLCPLADERVLERPVSTLVMFMSSSFLSSCRRTSVRATRVNTCHVLAVISVLLQTNECESDPCQHLSCSCRRHLCPLADERV